MILVMGILGVWVVFALLGGVVVGKAIHGACRDDDPVVDP